MKIIHSSNLEVYFIYMLNQILNNLFFQFRNPTSYDICAQNLKCTSITIHSIMLVTNLFKKRAKNNFVLLNLFLETDVIYCGCV